jgi:hypothetical protein
LVRGAAERPTGLLRLMAEAISSFFVSQPKDEKDAEHLGFAVRAGEPCPFSDVRLIRAFRRGGEQREEWEASAW